MASEGLTYRLPAERPLISIIVVYDLAAQFDSLVSERTDPRRIWFVVNEAYGSGLSNREEVAQSKRWRVVENRC